MDKCVLYSEERCTCVGLLIYCEGARKDCKFYKSCEEWTRDRNGYVSKIKGENDGTLHRL